MATAKRALRRRILDLRDATDPRARERAAVVVGTSVRDVLRDLGAGSVLAFWSFGSELPTEPLLEALVDEGYRLCLPKVVDRRLEVRTWRPGDALTQTSFGAREPAEGSVVPPSRLDVVLVPAVAFDDLGYRVGYGGGFYDRLLPQMRADAARIGIGLAIQRVARVPRDALDVPVDLIVTERGVEDVARRRSST